MRNILLAILLLISYNIIMERNTICLEEYITANGKVPFAEWLHGLKDRVARAKIRVRLDRVKLGNIGPHKMVGKGVNELILDFGPGYRVYYNKTKEFILLLYGGTKKGQQKDIEQAQEYLEDYRRREDENT